MIPIPQQKPISKADTSIDISPKNVRALSKDIFFGLLGAGEKVNNYTENDLQEAELKVLRKAAESARKRGSSSINYQDYQEFFTVDPERLISFTSKGRALTPAQIVKFSYTDPAYRMLTLFGGASLEEDESGNVYLVDKYDFNKSNTNTRFKEVMSSLEPTEILEMFTELGAYGVVRQIAEVLGSDETRTSESRINLGALGAKELQLSVEE